MVAGRRDEYGMRIRSYPYEDGLICYWQADERFHGFDGIVNGGIVGTLFDCHATWVAVKHFMETQGLERPPTVATVALEVQYKLPTPTQTPLELVARVVDSSARRATVTGELRANGQITATFQGVFVDVSGNDSFVWKSFHQSTDRKSS